MRIISLNTWGGRALHPLMEFFKKWRYTTDVFCLQEMHDTTEEYRERRHPGEHVCWNLLAKTRRALPTFSSAMAKFKDNPDRMSVATFWRNDLKGVDVGSTEIFRPKLLIEEGSSVSSPRRLQYIVIRKDGRELMVANYHGLWTRDGKADTPARLEQSLVIKRVLDRFSRCKVLCGDFNLNPDTRSLATLASGMRNLVKDYGIETTRTPLYRDWQQRNWEPFADYMFTSPRLCVQDFRVLPDLASDHAALCLDIDWP